MNLKMLRAINKARKVYNKFCPQCRKRFIQQNKPENNPTKAKEQTLQLLCEKCKTMYITEMMKNED